jgi:hypothetical protein
VRDAQHAALAGPLPAAVNGLCQIVTMNHIIVTPKEDMALTRLVFRYHPTFS